MTFQEPPVFSVTWSF